MVKNALWLFVFTIIILIIFLPSYTKLQDLKQKNLDYEYQIRQLTMDNDRLREERRRLEQDPVYLERVAREKMGLVRDGEVVYKLVPQQQNQENNISRGGAARSRQGQDPFK